MRIFVTFLTIFLIIQASAQATTIDQVNSRYKVGQPMASKDAAIIRNHMDSQQVRKATSFFGNPFITTTKYKHNRNLDLKNGYSMNVTGSSFSDKSLISEGFSVSASMGVWRTDFQPIQKISKTDIRYEVVAYGIIGKNGFGKVLDYALVADCPKSTTCRITSSRKDFVASMFSYTQLRGRVTMPTMTAELVAEGKVEYIR